ncbi:MAG: histidinol phosphatase [Microbacteriaceae bacterium BACL25 MAG-120322-bin65]|nr:MAG: histidinol phosphatase [Microbacteriaceae bacterium BACL25 MAG-120322-bin65]
MTTFTIADDLALALAAAANADLVSLDRFKALDLVVSTKPDNTPVTDADQAVERIIRKTIEASRPTDHIFGEEMGSSSSEPGPQSGRQWIIDPIDGTAGFSRGIPIWGTLIALAIDGKPVVGVVSAPALGQRWWGGKGVGAWTQRPGDKEATALAVSNVQNLSDATFSYNSMVGWLDDGRAQALKSLVQSVWRARAIGDFWAYMLVAEGALDIAGEADLQPYDMAALVPIVEEAGGRFSSLDGEEGIWDGTALATNSFLHDEVLTRVAKDSSA